MSIVHTCPLHQLQYHQETLKPHNSSIQTTCSHCNEHITSTTAYIGVPTLQADGMVAGKDFHPTITSAGVANTIVELSD